MDPKFESPKNIESAVERNARFALGDITEDEIRAHWKNPENYLFEHEIARQEGGIEKQFKFRVRALTEESVAPLLKEIESAWDEVSFQEISVTLRNFFKQKKLSHLTLSNIEYYIATDLKDNPFAITGLFTFDVGGGAGFATRDKLDLSRHNLIARGGWLAVGKAYQGSGIGSFLFNWKENLARSRGFKFMLAETDNYKNSETARRLYEKSGYKRGFYIEDYFGPGRALAVYFLDISKEKQIEAIGPVEIISQKNYRELLDFGTQIYSKDQNEEFAVCLDLFLEQNPAEKTVRKPHSLVLRDKKGGIKAFAMMTTGVYDNELSVDWFGAHPDEKNLRELVEALKGYAKSIDIDIIVLSNQGRNNKLLDAGFSEGGEGIPGVYGKGDPTKFLLYSKKL